MDMLSQYCSIHCERDKRKWGLFLQVCLAWSVTSYPFDCKWSLSPLEVSMLPDVACGGWRSDSEICNLSKDTGD